MELLRLQKRACGCKVPLKKRVWADSPLDLRSLSQKCVARSLCHVCVVIPPCVPFHVPIVVMPRTSMTDSDRRRPGALGGAQMCRGAVPQEALGRHLRRGIQEVRDTEARCARGEGHRGEVCKR